MIGCFKPKARENWKSLCITKSENEAYNSFLALNASFVHVQDIDGTNFNRVFNKYMTESDETESPIYGQVLDLEAIELHRLAQVIISNGGTILDLNTDCVGCVFPKDVFPFTMESDNSNIKDYYYDEAKTLPKYKIDHKDHRLEHPKLEKYKQIEIYDHVEPVWNIIPDVIDNNFDPLIDLSH